MNGCDNGMPCMAGYGHAAERQVNQVVPARRGRRYGFHQKAVESLTKLKVRSMTSATIIFATNLRRDKLIVFPKWECRMSNNSLSLPDDVLKSVTIENLGKFLQNY